VAECGRRLAGGWIAAIEEGPPLPRLDGASAGVPSVAVVWWPGPGVAFPKSRSLGCKPAALVTESFRCCPPGPRCVLRHAGHQLAGGRRWRC